MLSISVVTLQVKLTKGKDKLKKRSHFESDVLSLSKWEQKNKHNIAILRNGKLNNNTDKYT